MYLKGSKSGALGACFLGKIECSGFQECYFKHLGRPFAYHNTNIQIENIAMFSNQILTSGLVPATGYPAW